MSMLDQVLAQNDVPYGLDMSFQGLTGYGTRTGVDTTGMFEPLGLDLGGGFDNGGFADMGFNLGLGVEPFPVKKKVPAIVDVSKLIEGESSSVSVSCWTDWLILTNRNRETGRLSWSCTGFPQERCRSSFQSFSYPRFLRIRILVFDYSSPLPAKRKI
jgi:hypothetical protein